jgi:hypothetical protein
MRLLTFAAGALAGALAGVVGIWWWVETEDQRRR